MSRNLFAILLSELNIVRLVCVRNGCSGVAEMTIADLGSKKEHFCPACKGVLFLAPPNLPGEKAVHEKFAESVIALNNLQSMFQVEFVIPNDQGK